MKGFIYKYNIIIFLSNLGNISLLQYIPKTPPLFHFELNLLLSNIIKFNKDIGFLLLNKASNNSTVNCPNSLMSQPIKTRRKIIINFLKLFEV